MNYIRKISLIAVLVISFSHVFSQAVEDYQFTTIKEIPITSVKDQNRSGTCWSFSGIGLIESEMIRLGKPIVDLSEMFIVWHTYKEKAEKTVRMHGHLNFSAGGAFHDVTEVMNKYGIVPESVYTGLNYGEEKHVHGEMDEMLKQQVDAVVENKNRTLSDSWINAINSTLNSYLGEIPETFTYEGKEYSPKSFMKDYVGLNMEDYVEIASFTHHPFYSKFILEIPDNWMWYSVYNVPLEELEEIIDNAIDKGYTVAWAADVSERGFSTSNKGIAVIPDIDIANMSDAEISKWENMSAQEKENKLYELQKPGKEKEITQEIRQKAFDNYQTTDDHGMLIYGTAKDQNGTEYYKVKNSWGSYNKFDGVFYASKPYIRYKTMDIMVHKDAIPAHIRRKLNL